MATNTHELWIPGQPVTYPRSAITNKGHRMTPARYREWLYGAGRLIQESVPDAARNIEGPVAMTIAVHSEGVAVKIWELSQPLTDSKRFRPKHIRGDLDNYAKAVLDAIQWRDPRAPATITPDPLIVDDRQVVHLEVWFDADPYQGETK